MKMTCGEMKMISELKGLCSGDKNPDAWFPTVPNGGRPDTILRYMVPEIRYAINMCSRCPIQQDCLKEGMKPENLAYGIWGGLLAGQRIAIAKVRGLDYRVDPYNRGRQVRSRYTDDVGPSRKVTADEEEAATMFAARIRPYIKE
jgi:hypothetical protein